VIARQLAAAGNRRKSFAAGGACLPALPDSAAARGLQVLRARGGSFSSPEQQCGGMVS
jgi:hypothetical protein